MTILKQARIERGLTQVKLAAAAGMSVEALRLVENGKMRPFPAWRKRLAAALNVPEYELFPEAADQTQAAR